MASTGLRDAHAVHLLEALESVVRHVLIAKILDAPEAVVGLLLRLGEFIGVDISEVTITTITTEESVDDTVITQIVEGGTHTIQQG